MSDFPSDFWSISAFFVLSSLLSTIKLSAPFHGGFAWPPVSFLPTPNEFLLVGWREMWFG